MRAGLLLLPLLLLAAAADAQPDPGARFKEEFDRGVDLLRSGKNAEGIAAFERCLEILPDDPACTYNIACGHSLAGDKAKALEWLGKAADRGFIDVKLLAEDRDLNAIRGEAPFAPIHERVKANAARIAQEAKTAVVHEPPGYDRSKPFPLLLVLHGRGGNKTDFIRPFEEAADAAGFLLLSVQGTVPMGSGGFAWDDGGYLQTPGKYENAFLDIARQAKRERAIDPDRVYLLGFSEGAFMAFHAGLRAPGLFRGAIGIGGAYYPDRLLGAGGLRTASERGFRTYLMVGDKDSPAAKESAGRAAKELGAAGVRAETKTYAGAHELPDAASRKGTILEALRWLDANAPAPATKPSPASGDRRDG